MEEDKNPQREKMGEPGYTNKNCWLVKTLNYSPANRCQYCELKFRHCLFFQYLITSSVLIFFLFTLSFLIEGKISRLVAISIFVLVIIYGYFFNKSTEKIIKASFAQRKAKEALEEAYQETKKRKEDLEKFYKSTVDRELRMIELKKKIKELEEKLKEETLK